LDQIERNGNAVRIQLGEKRVEADLVLMATDREANSGAIGLGAFGIDDRSFLEVDKQMRLPAPGPYVVGDVNGI
jgi:pyruvate/2-oxoglutarate dehydrogenase complex dihydrolipoamide dehydrogenase (E3) component